MKIHYKRNTPAFQIGGTREDVQILMSIASAIRSGERKGIVEDLDMEPIGEWSLEDDLPTLKTPASFDGIEKL